MTRKKQVYMQSEVKLVSQSGRRGSDARHCVWNLQTTHLLKTAVSVLASTVRLTVSFIEPLVTVSVMRSLTGSSSGSEPSPTFPLGEVGVVSLGSHWSVSKTTRWFYSNHFMCWHVDRRNGTRVYSYFLAAWAHWLPEGLPFLCWSPWLQGNCSSKDPWG